MVTKTHIIQGRAQFAKIVGNPVPGYNNGPPEWQFDLVLDAQGKKDFLKSGADKAYIKNKEEIDYVRFTRKAVRSDGTPGKPIGIIDAQGKDWDQGILIGNGSVLNVAYTLNEITFNGKKRFKPQVMRIQVWDHQAYKPKNIFTVKEIQAEVVTNDEDEPTNW